MIMKYINTIAQLERREGKLGTMFGIIVLAIVALIGLGIALFGIHVMLEASKQLMVEFNDFWFK